MVQALRNAGHDVYDFRNPPSGDPGFHWTDVDEHCAEWSPAEYQANLAHPFAEPLNLKPLVLDCLLVRTYADITIYHKFRILWHII